MPVNELENVATKFETLVRHQGFSETDAEIELHELFGPVLASQALSWIRHNRDSAQVSIGSRSLPTAV